jgi:hypothetical protein
MTDGQLANLFWCQASTGAQDQIFVNVRQLRVCSCGASSLRRGQVCHLQLLLALAIAVISTTAKISSAHHLYLQFYMSAFYIVSCQRLSFLVDALIYSFMCNSIYRRPGIADHALTHVAHVTTPA